MGKVFVDIKIKSKIEDLIKVEEAYAVKFKDLTDTFWFDNIEQIQEFMNIQSRERVYDKELRKGFFDYISNETGETLRYHVKATRGNLEVLREENLGKI